MSKSGRGGLTGREWHIDGRLTINTDREAVMSGSGQRHVEGEDGGGLDIGDAGRWLTELHGAFAAEQFGVLVVEEADPERVHADFIALGAQPDHEVGARVHRWKPAHPHMPEDAQHRQLALLVEEGVVGEDGEVDVQVSSPGST